MSLFLQFLKGLGCLFPDGFAMRKFREIFQQYFAESLKVSQLAVIPLQ